jgi:hypothetical protein
MTAEVAPSGLGDPSAASDAAEYLQVTARTVQRLSWLFLWQFLHSCNFQNTRVAG